jgi:hypothetical protein
MANGLMNLNDSMVEAAYARYMQLKQSGMQDPQIYQLMDQEKTMVPLGQLAAKYNQLKAAAQQTPMPPQNTINEQIDQQLQAMQNPQQQGIGALPEAQQGQAPQAPQAPQGAPPQGIQQGMPQGAPPQQGAPQPMPPQPMPPQGMAAGGLASIPVHNVGDSNAYASGGIVAFAGGGDVVHAYDGMLARSDASPSDFFDPMAMYKRDELSPEEQEDLDLYDTNKDGKLSGMEISNMNFAKGEQRKRDAADKFTLDQENRRRADQGLGAMRPASPDEFSHPKVEHGTIGIAGNDARQNFNRLGSDVAGSLPHQMYTNPDASSRAPTPASNEDEDHTVDFDAILGHGRTDTNDADAQHIRNSYLPAPSKAPTPSSATEGDDYGYPDIEKPRSTDEIFKELQDAKERFGLNASNKEMDDYLKGVEADARRDAQRQSGWAQLSAASALLSAPGWQGVAAMGKDLASNMSAIDKQVTAAKREIVKSRLEMKRANAKEDFEMFSNASAKHENAVKEYQDAQSRKATFEQNKTQQDRSYKLQLKQLDQTASYYQYLKQQSALNTSQKKLADDFIKLRTAALNETDPKKLAQILDRAEKTQNILSDALDPSGNKQLTATSGALARDPEYKAAAEALKTAQFMQDPIAARDAQDKMDAIKARITGGSSTLSSSMGDSSLWTNFQAN